MDIETEIKLAIYRYFAEMGRRPTAVEVAERVGSDTADILDAYQRLADKRMLVLEGDGASIRMASPFSGVKTQHVVEANGRNYYANCAWDATGIIAALQSPGVVVNRRASGFI